MTLDINNKNTSESVDVVLRRDGIKSTIKIIILTVIFGFLSGMLGFLIVGQGGSGLPFFGKINFTDSNFDQRIVIDQPRNVIVDQEVQLAQVENKILPALLNIYLSKKSTTVLANAYLPADILGQGFVFTADGWIVAPGKAVIDPKIKYTAIGYQEKKYEATNFIVDSVTGMAFAKMGGNSLSVATLGDSSQLASGQTLIVINQRKNINIVHIKNIDYDFISRQSLVQSSEELNKKIVLDIILDSSYNGAVLANFKGEIVAMVNNGRVIPINYFKNVINQVLNGQKIVRPILGINYIDLSYAEGLIDLAQNGAYVYGSPVKTSPVVEKLKDGDIIKKVNDIELNSVINLSEALNNYKPGNKAYLTILRAKKEQVIQVQFN